MTSERRNQDNRHRVPHHDRAYTVLTDIVNLMHIYATSTMFYGRQDPPDTMVSLLYGV